MSISKAFTVVIVVCVLLPGELFAQFTPADFTYPTFGSTDCSRGRVAVCETIEEDIASFAHDQPQPYYTCAQIHADVCYGTSEVWEANCEVMDLWNDNLEDHPNAEFYNCPWCVNNCNPDSIGSFSGGGESGVGGSTSSEPTNNPNPYQPHATCSSVETDKTDYFSLFIVFFVLCLIFMTRNKLNLQGYFERRP